MFSMTRDDGHELAGDRERLDVALVHHWIATDTYGAPGRSRELMQAAIGGSTPFGVYRPDDGRQVAFARLVTDGAVFAYLSDVYVDPAVRGIGLGSWLGPWPPGPPAARGPQRLRPRPDD